MPVIAPVNEFRFKPVGKLPDWTAQVDALQLLAVSAWLIVCPFTHGPKEEGDMLQLEVAGQWVGKFPGCRSTVLRRPAASGGVPLTHHHLWRFGRRFLLYPRAVKIPGVRVAGWVPYPRTGCTNGATCVRVAIDGLRPSVCPCAAVPVFGVKKLRRDHLKP